MNADVHDLAGAYAVDALPDEERRFFERHLEDCRTCRGEVTELQATGALLGTAAWEAPPAGMRERVLSAAAATPQEAPEREQVSAASPPQPGRRERLRQLLPAVAAVIVLGVAGLTVVVTQTGVGDGPEEDTLAELVAAPDARIVDLAAPEGTTARLVWSAQRGEGLFLTEGLDAAPHGHAYALWVIEGETPPALVGMFQPDEDGSVSHGIAGQPPGGVTVAVTVEPEEGVDAPTTDPLIVGEL